MDPPDPFTNFSGRPSPTRRSAELQGPRPAPLKVNKDSHKIKKPPIPPPQNHHHHFPQPPLPPPYAAASTSHNPQPVIIYSVSPKVIHTTVSDFMNLVQSLTGTSTSTTGDTSPAARFASIEHTSPSQRERERSSLYSAAASVSAAAAASAAYDIEHTSPLERERETSTFYSSAAGVTGGAALYGGDFNDEISRILDESNYFSVGSQNYFPGILSPAAATLPPASPAGLFSPAVADPFIQAASNMFIPSPSTWFSAPMVSPSPSSSNSHLFNSIFDF